MILDGMTFIYHPITMGCVGDVMWWDGIEGSVAGRTVVVMDGGDLEQQQRQQRRTSRDRPSLSLQKNTGKVKVTTAVEYRVAILRLNSGSLPLLNQAHGWCKHGKLPSAVKMHGLVVLVCPAYRTG